MKNAILASMAAFLVATTPMAPARAWDFAERADLISGMNQPMLAEVSLDHKWAVLFTCGAVDGSFVSKVSLLALDHAGQARLGHPDGATVDASLSADGAPALSIPFVRLRDRAVARWFTNDRPFSLLDVVTSARSFVSIRLDGDEMRFPADAIKTVSAYRHACDTTARGAKKPPPPTRGVG